MNEDILKRALAGTVAERYSEYGENDIKHTFSIGYRLKINMLIRKVRHGNINNTTRIIPVLRLNIILIAIFIAILTASAFMIWYHINGFSFKVEPTNLTVYMDSIENQKYEITEIYRISDNMGCVLVNQGITDVSVVSVYEIDGKKFTLIQGLINQNFHIDTEGQPIESLNIKDNNGYCVELDGEIMLAWLYDGYVFNIVGNIDKKTAVDLANATII